MLVDYRLCRLNMGQGSFNNHTTCYPFSQKHRHTKRLLYYIRQSVKGEPMTSRTPGGCSSYKLHGEQGHSFLAQWIECPSGVQEVMGFIPVEDSDFFSVPHLCHVDQFTFHISLPNLKFTTFTHLRQSVWSTLLLRKTLT